jgi:hypothetical protein
MAPDINYFCLYSSFVYPLKPLECFNCPNAQRAIPSTFYSALCAFEMQQQLLYLQYIIKMHSAPLSVFMMRDRWRSRKFVKLEIARPL